MRYIDLKTLPSFAIMLPSRIPAEFHFDAISNDDLSQRQHVKRASRATVHVVRKL